MLVRLKRLVDLLPPLIIFIIVMGSIYSGWATSTEAAALAVIVTLPIAASTAGSRSACCTTPSCRPST